MSLLGRMFRTRRQENHILINIPTGCFPLFIDIECCDKWDDKDTKGTIIANPDIYFYQYRNTTNLHSRSINNDNLKAHGLSGYEMKSIKYAQHYKDGISNEIRAYQRMIELDILSFLTKKKLVDSGVIMHVPGIR